MNSQSKKLASKLIDDLLSRMDEKDPEENQVSLQQKKGPQEHSPLSISSSLSSVESLLGPSENLRLAQKKVLHLESEIEILKRENIDLLTSGEIFKNESEALVQKLTSTQSQYDQAKELFKKEKDVLEQSLALKKKEVDQSKKKAEMMKEYVNSNIQKIKHREQDLENRLDLLKRESDLLLKSKNKMILDLKRQMNSIQKTMDSYKTKGEELNQKLSDKQNLLKKTVKALHIALNLLEQP